MNTDLIVDNHLEHSKKVQTMFELRQSMIGIAKMTAMRSGGSISNRLATQETA
jgi:hypothetical protein